LDELLNILISIELKVLK